MRDERSVRLPMDGPASARKSAAETWRLPKIGERPAAQLSSPGDAGRDTSLGSVLPRRSTAPCYTEFDPFTSGAIASASFHFPTGDDMPFIRSLAVALLALGALGGTAHAQPKQEKLDFILNWVPGGDHVPYYYAKKMGWYRDAGIDLTIEPGKGSALAVQKVGAGANQIGLADMANALVGRSKGADVVGVFNVYANSPQGLYWLKSSGIKSIKDLAGKKIGNPAGDGARAIWPALAKANGIDPASVTWVNIDANSKLAALKSKSIDATTSFYNIHHIFQKELGDDMGFVAWKDVGLNTYGNTIIVNGDYLKKNKPVVANFVKVTQKAFAACVKEPKPCVQAMIEANGALQFDNELTNWGLVEALMSDKFSKTVALGVLDDARMAADYELVKTYIGMDKPFDVKSAYTNEFLDTSVKMTK
jgi:NitT/TauT family transport system substrate-binding protein